MAISNYNYHSQDPTPEGWVKETDFGNAEAIGYLADRLASYGIEKELYKKGAKAGDEVRIGLGDEAVIFDWEPSIEAGAELHLQDHQYRKALDIA